LSLSKVAVAFSFPEDSYDRPQGLAAVTTACSHPQAAKDFVKFLASAEGQKVIQDHGLTPLAAPAQSAAAQTGPGPSSDKVRGPKDAKVLVQAFYPRSGHEEILKTIFALADRYPGKVRVEHYNWADNPDDRKVWRSKGLSCGAILINGKQTFEYTDTQGKRHQVTFMMGMGGEWTKEDLDAVVAQIVAQMYPNG